jgi:hypothetical protein
VLFVNDSSEGGRPADCSCGRESRDELLELAVELECPRIASIGVGAKPLREGYRALIGPDDEVDASES